MILAVKVAPEVVEDTMLMPVAKEMYHPYLLLKEIREELQDQDPTQLYKLKVVAVVAQLDLVVEATGTEVLEEQIHRSIQLKEPEAAEEHLLDTYPQEDLEELVAEVKEIMDTQITELLEASTKAAVVVAAMVMMVTLEDQG